jgi:hypothetical protein
MADLADMIVPMPRELRAKTADLRAPARALICNLEGGWRANEPFQPGCRRPRPYALCELPGRDALAADALLSDAPEWAFRELESQT